MKPFWFHCGACGTRFGRAIAGLLFIGLCFRAGGQSPSIHRTEPLALATGRTTLLTLVGERLSTNATVWTSFPAQISNTDSPATFRVTPSTAAAFGIGAFRVATEQGISDLQLVMFDELPTVTSLATNNSVAAAQLLPLPAAVDATCAELTSRFYRLQLRGHQRVTIEVVANRIDSLLDPFVRVRDSRGRELASVDDTPGCEADARIEFIAPAAGAYFIEVRDTRHGGGPRYFFRLRIDGSAAEPLRFLPLMTSWKPAEPALPIFVEPAAKEAPTRTSVVHLVQPPVCIHGRFDAPGDRDVFQFATDKDEQWLIRGRSRTLSSPCDLYLRLEKPDGGLIAEADSTRADDGNLTNKFAEASTARLVVEELNHGGGPGFDYQIEIRPNDPGFTLNAGTNTITASPGGSFELKISAARWNFDGPIALSLAGLGKDFALTNEVLVVKQKDTTLKVTVPADFSATQLVSFSVIGNAANGERRLESRASTLPSLKAQLPQMLHPPLELDGLIFLGIQPENAPAK